LRCGGGDQACGQAKPMTSLLNFIRWLLKVWVKEVRTKTLETFIMKLMQSFAIRVFEEMFYLLLFGSTGFKVDQCIRKWLGKL
jgi:hypothetical protein